MKNRLHLLMLLGLVCAGFSWQIPGMALPLFPVVYALLGLAVLRLRRGRRLRYELLESVLLLAAIVVTYNLGHLGPNRLVFLANALSVYQLFRLAFPMTLRQQRFALAVALAQIATGALILLEPLRFLILFGLLLWLLPGALAEVQARAYEPTATGRARLPRLSAVQWLAIAALVVAFFVGFPRVGRVRRMPGRALGLGGDGSQMEPELDMDNPTSTGRRLLFRVYGGDLGYLRMDSLGVFDGTRWRADTEWSRKSRGSLQRTPAEDMLFRRVKVISSSATETALPADYHVRGVDLPVRQHVLRANNGAIITTHRLPANSVYEYWTRKEPRPAELRRTADLGRYTDLSAYQPPPRLQAWLTEFLAGAETQSAVIDRLTDFFQEEGGFEYRLGTPDLDRLNPTEDFVLDTREGHCERYASAMAVLLRLENIPSRVVRGFVPREFNRLGEFYNIRTEHAHAWVEAWLPNRGWVRVDPTPTGRQVQMVTPNPFRSTYDWLEELWYARIVEFDAGDQGTVISLLSRTTSFIGRFGARNWQALTIGALCAAAVLLLFRINWRLPRWTRRKQEPSAAAAQREVRTFYDRLLHLLARDGLCRAPSQTPLQLARQATRRGHPAHEAVTFITRAFCSVRYGRRRLQPQTRTEIQDKLDNIARKNRPSPD